MDEKDLKIQELLKENAVLKKINAEQAMQIEKLIMRISELEKRLGKNSNNSSKPPSSDGLNKPPRTGSLREKGKNPSGGQKGHEGVTLRQKENPDKIVRHGLERCPHCQNTLNGKVIGFLKRQVFDIPPVKIEVTEHKAEIKICSCCNKEIHAEFPKGVDFPVQYGARIKAQAVYFSEQHYVPEDRLQMIFQDLYGVQIATATLVKFNVTTQPFYVRLQTCLIKAQNGTSCTCSYILYLFALIKHARSLTKCLGSSGTSGVLKEKAGELPFIEVPLILF